MSTALILFPSGEYAEVDFDQVAHLQPPPAVRAFQIAINTGRPRRKGRPYVGGDENRSEDGYFHGPENAIVLTYQSDLDLATGDRVLVPLGNHHNPRVGIVIASSSAYVGDLRSVYGYAD